MKFLDAGKFKAFWIKFRGLFRGYRSAHTPHSERNDNILRSIGADKSERIPFRFSWICKGAEAGLSVDPEEQTFSQILKGFQDWLRANSPNVRRKDQGRDCASKQANNKVHKKIIRCTMAGLQFTNCRKIYPFVEIVRSCCFEGLWRSFQTFFGNIGGY